MIGICHKTAECTRAFGRETYRAKSPAEPFKVAGARNARERGWWAKLDFVAAYGGCCACCGETNPKYLTADHVNADGFADVGVNYRVTSYQIYARAKFEGDPDRYQALCTYCNSSKGSQTSYVCGCTSLSTRPIPGQLTLF